MMQFTETCNPLALSSVKSLLYRDYPAGNRARGFVRFAKKFENLREITFEDLEYASDPRRRALLNRVTFAMMRLILFEFRNLGKTFGYATSWRKEKFRVRVAQACEEPQTTEHEIDLQAEYHFLLEGGTADRHHPGVMQIRWTMCRCQACQANESDSGKLQRDELSHNWLSQQFFDDDEE